jgi:hypothetical protein
MCGDAANRLTGHDKFAWLMVWLSSIVSWFGIFWVSFMVHEISAPQQCAAIAGAIGFTLTPYCYARAVERFE